MVSETVCQKEATMHGKTKEKSNFHWINQTQVFALPIMWSSDYSTSLNLSLFKIKQGHSWLIGL